MNDYHLPLCNRWRFDTTYTHIYVYIEEVGRHTTERRLRLLTVKWSCSIHTDRVLEVCFIENFLSGIFL